MSNPTAGHLNDDHSVSGLAAAAVNNDYPSPDEVNV